MFHFDIQPIGGFDLFITGRSHVLLSERSLSFSNAMITLTSARWGARIAELALDVGKPQLNTFYSSLFVILKCCKVQKADIQGF